MEKTVKIDGKDVRLKCSAGLPRLYRLLFNRDVFTDFSEAITDDRKKGTVVVSLDLMEDLTFAMAKHADPAFPYPDVENWLGSLDDPGAVTDVLPDVLDLWSADKTTLAEPKKK